MRSALRLLLTGIVTTAMASATLSSRATAQASATQPDERPIDAAGQPDDAAPFEPPHELAGNLAYYSTGDDASDLRVLRFHVDGRYALSRDWSLSGRMGMVALDSSPDAGPGDFVLRFGNPEVLAWYDGLYHPAEGGQRRRLRLRFALGGTGPLAAVDRGRGGRLSRAALSNAAGMDGFATLWLWAPSRSAAVTAALLSWDAHRDLLVEAEAWPALFIPSREQWMEDPVDFMVPITVGARTRGGLISVGPYLRAAWMPTARIDTLQWSLEPRARVELWDVFVELRGTFNLGEPLSGARGPGVWGAHLAAGGQL